MDKTVATFLLLAAFRVSYASSGSCFQQKACKNVSYVEVPIGAVVGSSPLFVHVVPDTPHMRKINNICYSYFWINQTAGEVLLFISEVENDGTNNIQACIVTSTRGRLKFVCFEGPGYFRKVSESAIVATDFILGTPCGNISAIYRCYEFQNCKSEFRDIDYRYGGTGAMEIPYECKLKVIELANNPMYNFVGRDFLILPNTNPWQCITEYNGAKCIGSEKVNSTNSRSLP